VCFSVSQQEQAPVSFPKPLALAQEGKLAGSWPKQDGLRHILSLSKHELELL
jgi:hypothetical protein